jgi:hypothetical protein
MSAPPERDEAAEYYFRYIDLVPPGNICESLRTQGAEVLEVLQGISEEDSAHRYAPDKWSIGEVVNHLIDCERLFVFRAFWFARGFDSPLPSFDQHLAVETADAARRPWPSLVVEFSALRGSTLAFFRTLPEDAWARRGIASGNPFSVRALAWLTAGHVTHHLGILRERYLAAFAPPPAGS